MTPQPTAPTPPTPPRPDGATSDGTLAATVGGVLGALLGVTVGVAVGAGLAEIYSDPDAGLGNLWVLVFPIGLGALGIVTGLATGVMVALRRGGHALVAATAWLTVPFAIGGVVALAAYGLGVVVLLATPAVARWLVLRAARDRSAPASWPPPSSTQAWPPSS